MTRPTRAKGGWEVRLRVGKGRRETFRLPALDEDLANDRAARLERMRDLLVSANRYEEVSKLLSEAAQVAADDALFEEAELAAQEIAGGKTLDSVPLQPRTFRDVCDLWNSGELHKRYPHRVAKKQPKTVAKDAARLEKVCATIGSIPISRVTEADCDRAIAALPPLAPSTLAKYAQVLAYVLKLAASPLKLIKRTPLPDDWVPSGGERAEFQMLYPDEEETLMGCEHLSLEQKYFWGFLAREGLSLQEAFDLTWGEVDLAKGTVRVVRSKTGRPRRWTMGDDVVYALRAKKPVGAGTSDKVFSPDVERQRAAEDFRLDLKQCGILRQELHESTALRRRIRAHDLRGTFVALSLALGRSDQWIMDRTGHSQSQMLRVYDRDSRFAASAKLGWFGPLDLLLGVGERVARDEQEARENACLSESNVDFSGEDTLPSQPETAAERQPHDAEEVARHPGARGGQKSWPSGEDPTAAPKTKGAAERVVFDRSQRELGPDPVSAAPADPVERALAFALEEATRAQRWDVVLEVTRELQRRQVASKPEPGVTSLDAHRRKNGGDK